jgi:two-component system, chemotaxis family, sensor kinase CheA
VLADLLQLDRQTASEDWTLLVLRLTSGELFALAVDRLDGHGELVVKPVAPAIIATGLYAGTTLSEDGKPILLLEVTGLARKAGLQLERLERSERAIEDGAHDAAARKTAMLLFIGLDGKRKAMPMGVIDRLEEVDVAAVQAGAGRMLVVVGDSLLPLAGTDGACLPETILRLFRLSDGQREIAYAIHEAMDIREVDAALLADRSQGQSDSVVMVDGLPTAVVAPHPLFARHATAPRSAAPPVCHLPADDAWMQNFIRPLVEAAGYRVVDEAGEQVDLAIMAENEAGASVSARKTLRLRSRPGEEAGKSPSIYRYDHAGLLAALQPVARRMGL